MTGGFQLLVGFVLAASIGNSISQPRAGEISAGSEIYESECLACHQADGGGVPYMQPALVDSSVVSGDRQALISFLLLGSAARTHLDAWRNRPESEFGNEMAGFAFLDDAAVAAVATFIRQAFADLDDCVTPAEVAAVRSHLDDAMQGQ